jgi:hypothetical protein
LKQKPRKKKMTNEAEKVETETVQRVSHPPLPDPAIAERDAVLDSLLMIDEQLLEYTCHQLFDLYQKTGNHEVRRLAMLTGQLGAAILGADPREFFPEAPPISDSQGSGGAPTYPNHNNRAGWSEAPSQGYQPMQMNVPATSGQVHQHNPSGAEMRVVSDPSGTMTGIPVNPQYMPPQPGQVDPRYAQQQPQPQPQFPQTRRQRRMSR